MTRVVTVWSVVQSVKRGLFISILLSRLGSVDGIVGVDGWEAIQSHGSAGPVRWSMIALGRTIVDSHVTITFSLIGLVIPLHCLSVKCRLPIPGVSAVPVLVTWSLALAFGVV